MLAIGALFDSREDLFAELGVSTALEAVYKTDMCIIDLADSSKVLLGHYYMQHGDCFSVAEWERTVASLADRLPAAMRHRMHVAYL